MASRVLYLTPSLSMHFQYEVHRYIINQALNGGQMFLILLLTVKVFVRHGDFTNLLRFLRHVHVRSRSVHTNLGTNVASLKPRRDHKCKMSNSKTP